MGAPGARPQARDLFQFNMDRKFPSMKSLPWRPRYAAQLQTDFKTNSSEGGKGQGQLFFSSSGFLSTGGGWSFMPVLRASLNSLIPAPRPRPSSGSFLPPKKISSRSMIKTKCVGCNKPSIANLPAPKPRPWEHFRYYSPAESQTKSIFAKDHVGGPDSPLAAVLEVKHGVAGGDVVCASVAELLRHFINPAPRPFELDEVADGRFVEGQLRMASGPRVRTWHIGRPKFLVAKNLSQSKALENPTRVVATRYRRFNFFAHLIVCRTRGRAFESQHPAAAFPT